ARPPDGRLSPHFLTAASFFLVVAGEPALAPALAWAFYSVGSRLPRRPSLRYAGVALLAAAIATAIHPSHSRALGSALSSLIILVGAWLVGDNVRTRRERTEEQSQQAVANERARIARELHDMVTHNVSVM